MSARRDCRHPGRRRESGRLRDHRICVRGGRHRPRRTIHFGSANDGAGYELTAIAACDRRNEPVRRRRLDDRHDRRQHHAGALANILQLNNVNASLQLLATGAIIVLAAALQTMVGRREGSMR